jgi:hypothetical protein
MTIRMLGPTEEFADRFLADRFLANRFSADRFLASL